MKIDFFDNIPMIAYCPRITATYLANAPPASDREYPTHANCPTRINSYMVVN